MEAFLFSFSIWGWHKLKNNYNNSSFLSLNATVLSKLSIIKNNPKEIFYPEVSELQNKCRIPRNDSEFSLGLTRSESFENLATSIGDLCYGGQVAVYFAKRTSVMVLGSWMVWKFIKTLY
jgi:hypothetical protein